MRTYKFRGKDVNTGIFVFGNLVKTPYGEFIIPQNIIDDSLPQWKVDHETVGQFIGLHDKNEKEIYEGDIVTWFINGKKVAAPIYYDEHQATFWMGEDIEGEMGLVLNDWYRGEYEIIGNIYGNPELIV